MEKHTCVEEEGVWAAQGSYADSRIIEEADLVTEMKEVKHYYKQGVMARDGIEK